MSKKTQSNFMLLMTALIWGIAFVAQKSGAVLGAFTYNGIRTFLGGIALLPLILYYYHKDHIKLDAVTLRGGLCCGAALFVASSFQQIGIAYTTAGKAGFITSLYAILVPMIAVFMGRRIRPVIWGCALLGTVGLYLLTMQGDVFRLSTGDTYVLLCAFCFALHILIIDYFSPRVNGLMMSCIQFLTAGLAGMICMLLFEAPNSHAIMMNAVPILYGGVLSCGVAYTLQIIAQKHADPTEASLILCLESVFSVIAGMFILGERLSLMNLVGCLLIFTAVVISQLPDKGGAS